jgi:hypothetical protein
MKRISAKRRRWLGEPPLAAPPTLPGYMLWTVARADAVSLAVCGAVLAPAWVAVFIALVGLLGGRDTFAMHLTPTTVVAGSVVALVLTPALHELLHGGVARATGARPAFGVGRGYVYTTFREPLRRGPYLAVALAPCGCLSVVSLGLAATWDQAAGWLIFAGVVNAAGSINDLWMAWRILRAPRHAQFCDVIDGFAILLPECERARSSSRHDA